MIKGSIAFRFAAKKLIFGQNCSQVITSTAAQIAKVVTITLGPMGRNVLIQNQKHQPRITKDGVTVAKHLEYEDRLKDAICTLIKQSVNSTNKFAGDGTTTSSLLIGQLLKRANKLIEAGYSSREIKEGLKIGKQLSLQFLKMSAQPASTEKDFFQVAMIATKGDNHLSTLISQAVSRSELLSVEKTERTESFVEKYFAGVKMVAGLTRPQFKNKGEKTELNYPLVFLSRKSIDKIEEVLPLLQLARKSRKQVLLVGTNISESVLSTLIYNKMKNIVEVYPVLLHNYSSKVQEYFQQLAKITQASIFDQYGPCHLQEIQFKHLGKAVKVEIDEIETVVTAKADSHNTSAVVYAGGATQAIALQVQDKIIDALNSVKTAKKRGVIAGGGVTYWRMAEMLQLYSGEYQIGVKILAQALKEPRRALVKNIPNWFGALGGQGWEGYDFRSGKLEDMFQVGIIDSVTVGQSVLIDSVSLTQMLIDIQVAIVREAPKSDSQKEIEKIQKEYTL